MTFGLGFGLSLGYQRKLSSGVVIQLPAFAFDTDAQAWFTTVDAALTAAGQTNLTYAEKMAYSRLYTRMKAESGLYARMVGMGGIGPRTLGVNARAQTIAKIDMINPIKVSTVVGTLTFGDGNGFVSGTSPSYLNTNIAGNTIGTQDDWHIGLLTYKMPNETWSASTIRSMGVLGASTVGISIRPYDTSTSKPAASGGGSGAAVTAVGATDGGGFVVVSRSSSTQYVGYRNGTNPITVTETSTPLPTGNIFVGACNNNGSATASSTQYRNAGYTCGRSLTASQVKALYAAIKSTVDFFAFGLPTWYAPGTQPAVVNADFIVYGITSSGIAAAYEAARQGLSVAIVGGWRDHLGSIGGMMSNGLGFSDFDKPSSLAGLAKYHLYSANLKAAKTADTFEPRLSFFTFCEWLDSTRAAGKSIPIYFSTGVTSVAKTGTTIASFTTGDGRTFNASYFLDCSYEGDLMSLSGVTYIVGREDAGAGTEGYNGWRGTQLLPTAQLNYNGTAVVVDPFITAGNPASGKLNGLQDWPAGRANGSGDWVKYKNRAVVAQNAGGYTPMTQSYNYRMTMTQNDISKTIEAWETTPPATYNAADFAILPRFDAAVTAIGNTLTIGNLLKIDPLPSNNALDVNTNNGFSTDLLFGSWAYPEATYTQRETIVQNHINWIQNLFYAHRNNTGLSSTIRTAANGYHLHNEHYLNNLPQDPVFWPCQPYVRESRRMVGDFVLGAEDVFQADGTVPRSIKTIAVISYAIDSHQMGRYAYQRNGVWEVFMEGSFPALGTGNTDMTSPLPYEAALPAASECTNLAVTFGGSFTHVVFGAVRMEFTALNMGQAVGMAVVVAKQAGNIALQDVDYPTLRNKLLNNTLLNANETVPYLPQVN